MKKIVSAIVLIILFFIVSLYSTLPYKLNIANSEYRCRLYGDLDIREGETLAEALSRPAVCIDGETILYILGIEITSQARLISLVSLSILFALIAYLVVYATWVIIKKHLLPLRGR